jgi:hypothetical protein
VIDEQETAGFEALFKVSDGLLLLTLIAEIVWHVSEGVTQTDNGIEASLNDRARSQIIIECQPVGLLDDCAKKGRKEECVISYQ